MTPPDSLRVGLMGCGHISSAHLHGWAKTSQSRVTAVFDLDHGAAESTARRFRVPRVANSMSDLVETADVVDICTPPQAHGEQLTAALQAGRHVLIEKPVVLTHREWVSVARLLKANDLQLAVVHHLKFINSVLRAKQWVDQGLIGRVLRMESLFLTDPMHDRMLTTDSHWSHPLPGGRWLETLPHNLYLIHLFAGPLAVSSITAVATAARPNGVSADEVSVSFQGADRLATIHFSAHCGLNVRTATIIGSHGIIRLDLLSNLATIHRIGDNRLTRSFGRGMLEAVSQAAQSAVQKPMTALRRLRGWTPHAVLIAAFEQQLVGSGSPPTPVAEIEYVVRTCEEIGREIDRQAK